MSNCFSCPILPNGNTNPVHKHSDNTYWFWDETWTDEIGPFLTEDIANKKASEYGKSL